MSLRMHIDINQDQNHVESMKRGSWSVILRLEPRTPEITCSCDFASSTQLRMLRVMTNPADNISRITGTCSEISISLTENGFAPEISIRPPLRFTPSETKIGDRDRIHRRWMFHCEGREHISCQPT
jgi:hypothetical protein